MSKTTAAMAEEGFDVMSSPGGSVGTWITRLPGVWAATAAGTAISAASRTAIGEQAQARHPNFLPVKNSTVRRRPSSKSTSGS